MTLDALIDMLAELRARYPAAGTATVEAPVDFEGASYEHGAVQLALVFLVDDEDDDDDPLAPTLVH
jgi:hypothetical protein